MPTTTNYGFYSPPLTGVTPDVPRDSQTLANAVDVALKAEETARIAGDAMVQGSRTHNTATSTANGVFTAIPFDTMDLDEIPWTGSTSNFWTVPTAGYYQINAAAHFAANTTGYRAIRISINNGTSFIGTSYYAASSSGGTSAHTSRGVKLSAGDTVRIECIQNSGGALALAATSPRLVWADITRVGR